MQFKSLALLLLSATALAVPEQFEKRDDTTTLYVHAHPY